MTGALATGLAGGSAIALAELVAIGSPRSGVLVAVVLALCVGLGAAVGAALAMTRAL
jgi:hypothetical protein